MEEYYVVTRQNLDEFVDFLVTISIVLPDYGRNSWSKAVRDSRLERHDFYDYLDEDDVWFEAEDVLFRLIEAFHTWANLAKSKPAKFQEWMDRHVDPKAIKMPARKFLNNIIVPELELLSVPNIRPW